MKTFLIVYVVMPCVNESVSVSVSSTCFFFRRKTEEFSRRKDIRFQFSSNVIDETVFKEGYYRVFRA